MRRVANLISYFFLLVSLYILGCQSNNSNNSSNESNLPQNPLVFNSLVEITSENESTYLVRGRCNVDLGSVTVTIGEPNIIKSLRCQDDNTFSGTFVVREVVSNPATVSVRQRTQIVTSTVANLMNRFVTRWNFDSGLEFTLPLKENLNYDFSVDWGDGSEIGEVTSFNDSDKIHTYDSGGEYIITIVGLCEGFENSGLFTDNLIEVINLGNMGWKDLSTAFYDNFNLLRVSGGETSQVTDMQEMFDEATSVSLDLSGWDTSSVTNMNYMFSDVKMARLDLSNWDVSSVINMSDMFGDAKITKLDLSNWDASSVIDMSGMFDNAEISNLNLSEWDTSSVTNMNRMFDGAKIPNLNLRSLSTSSVTNMNSMFDGAEISNLNLSGWDTSSVTNMNRMFANTDIYYLVGESSWDTSSVISMDRQFFSSDLNPDVSRWDTSSVTNMNSMFSGTSNANPDTTQWNFSSVSSIENIFDAFSGLSMENYSTFLRSVAASINPNVTGRIGGNRAISNNYDSSAVSARQTLIDQGWTINDGGPQ